MAWWRRFVAWWRGPPAPAAAPEPPLLLLPAPEPKPEPRKRAPRRPVAGLKRGILERLDEYQVYIRRLRKHDPDAFTQYRRVGAYVLDDITEAHRDQLEPGLRAQLPTFGAIGMALSREFDQRKDGEDDYILHIKFIYFTKLTRPGPWIERTNAGVVYRCVAYFDNKPGLDADRRLKLDHGVSEEYAVCVAPDGDVRALRVLKQQVQRIRHRDRSTSHVTHQRWGLPMVSDRTGVNRALAITDLFCLGMNFWHAAARQSMIRVTATKGDLVMPFTLDVFNAPRFFADRETTVNDNGRKRRIFHVVRAHARTTRSGKTVHRRLSFRGLRDFAWHGYRINITVPGLDHVDLADATFGAYDEMPEGKEADDVIELPEMAERMADAIGAPSVATP